MDEHPNEAVDFYGINTYQWCGEQTFYTSGYNTLVEDYSSYTLPIFFSEYGCNEVTPRKFGEVTALYSNDMTGSFSGGLAYQYSQEPNNYGLVELAGDGTAKLLADFFSLKQQFLSLPGIDYEFVALAMEKDFKDYEGRKRVQRYGIPICEEEYSNLDISRGLPPSISSSLTQFGVGVKHGEFIELTSDEMTCSFDILDENGDEYAISKTIEPVVDYMSGLGYEKIGRIRKYKSGTYDYSSDDSDSEYDSSDSSDDDVEATMLAKASSYVRQMFDSIRNLFGSHQ